MFSCCLFVYCIVHASQGLLKRKCCFLLSAVMWPAIKWKDSSLVDMCLFLLFWCFLAGLFLKFRCVRDLEVPTAGIEAGKKKRRQLRSCLRTNINKRSHRTISSSSSFFGVVMRLVRREEKRKKRKRETVSFGIIIVRKKCLRVHSAHYYRFRFFFFLASYFSTRTRKAAPPPPLSFFFSSSSFFRCPL